MKTTIELVLELAKSIIVKREDIAEKYEDISTIRDFDRFQSLLMGSDPYDVIYKYDPNIIADVMDITYNKAVQYSRNPKSIPFEYLEQLNFIQRRKYTDEYVERNWYYNLLMGKPYQGEKIAKVEDIGDEVLVPYIGYPVHALAPWVIDHLWNFGGMEKLIKIYPDCKYLNHLGKKAVDFYTARKAKHLDILYYDNSIDMADELKEKFFKEYYIQRNFHMNLLYDEDLFLYKDMYSGFVGFLILIAAIRGTLEHELPDLRVDEEFINAALKSYDLYDYFEDMYLDKKIQIIRNIDELLKYSGSDKVLISVAKLFGYNTKIARYHLMKTHKMDNGGNYLFIKKPDGTWDYDKMYNLNFVKVDVASDKLDINDSNLLSFDEVTRRDELWLAEDSYKEIIKKQDFNMDLSKYVSIENAYDLTALVHEMAFFLNFLVDNKNNVRFIRKSNHYSTTGSSDIFTYLIFFFCVICKKSNYGGNIIYEPDELGRMMKYNFNVTKEQIDDINKKYNLGIDPEDFLLRKDKFNYTLGHIKRKYQNYQKLYQKLKIIREKETDYERYRGLTELYNLLYTHFSIKEIFKLKDGSLATKYTDVLKQEDKSLYEKLRTTEGAELDKMSKYVINSLDELFHSVDLNFLFLNTPDTQDPKLIAYFKKMVNLFLSSVTTLDTFNILFTIKNNEHAIRVFPKIISHKNEAYNDNIFINDKVATHRKTVIRDGVIFSNSIRNLN